MPPKDEEQSATGVTEGTWISLKVMFSIIGIILAFGAIFAPGLVMYFDISTKMAKVQTTLDVLTAAQLKSVADSEALVKKVNDHINDDIGHWLNVDQRLGSVEKVGSEALRKVEDRLNQLTVDFRVHTVQPPTK